MDDQFNQSDSGDVASGQKIKYFLSDQYRNPSTKAKKIAKVSGN